MSKEYRCKECRGIMYEEDGMWNCALCKRSIKAPPSMPASIVSHGLERKDMMAAEAYQCESPEFPLSDVQEE